MQGIGYDCAPVMHMDFPIHGFVAVRRGEITCVLLTRGYLATARETVCARSDQYIEFLIHAQNIHTPHPGKCSMRSLSTALKAAVAQSAKRIAAIADCKRESGITNKS